MGEGGGGAQRGRARRRARGHALGSRAWLVLGQQGQAPGLGRRGRRAAGGRSNFGILVSWWVVEGVRTGAGAGRLGRESGCLNVVGRLGVLVFGGAALGQRLSLAETCSSGDMLSTLFLVMLLPAGLSRPLALAVSFWGSFIPRWRFFARRRGSCVSRARSTCSILLSGVVSQSAGLPLAPQIAPAARACGGEEEALAAPYSPTHDLCSPLPRRSPFGRRAAAAPTAMLEL